MMLRVNIPASSNAGKGSSQWRRISFFAAILISLSNLGHAQGFLEMPDTTEVPEYERESMLLDLDIPSVRERDPDPEAGPRLNIREFRLQGIVEYPELGITREALVKQVENIRFDLMREGQVTESGFTLEELGELSQLVMDIEKSTQTQHVGPLEVQKFVFLVRDQLRRRGVTLGMIETVADTITQFYRERGFILAKAYIPKQKVRDGVVSLTLLLGELGAVEVEDSKRASEKFIKRIFKHDIHQPVTNSRIDEALYLVNDIPGLSAQGFFSPGQQVGDTSMTVKVLEEKWTSVNLRLDNHGSENTSENRAYADVYVHNPLGFGDEIYLAILNSYSPDASTFGSFRYNSMIYTPRLRGSLGFSTNDFVSRNIQQTGAVFFSGESSVADVSVSYQFKRSRVKNYAVDVSYTDIDTSLDTSSSITQETAQRVSLGFNFDVLNEKRRQLYIGNVSLNKADTFASGGFSGEVDGSDTFAALDLSVLSFFKFPFTKIDTRALFKAAAQYSGKSLSTLSQINLTGPSRARGFGVNGFQADDGVYVGVDWIFNLPRFIENKIFGENSGRVIQPYLFADGAYGIINPIDINDEEVKGRLSNVGFGMRINFKGVNGSVSWSNVLTDNVDSLEVETPRSSVYFDIQYAF